MLSSDTKKRLQAALAAEKTYHPNDTIAGQLREKTLVMLVGPASVGKSFIIHAITHTDDTFGFAPSFSTRNPRDDDKPEMFHLYPHNDSSVNQLLDLIDARAVVQYAIHPTSERIYGSMPEAYSKQFTLLPTLSSIAASLRQLPFKKTIVIGLAAQPDVWKKRFNQRYPDKNDERERRRLEAVSSLSWLLAPEQQSTVHWVDNTANQSTKAVQSVIRIVKYNEPGDRSARNLARTMIEHITKEMKKG